MEAAITEKATNSHEDGQDGRANRYNSHANRCDSHDESGENILNSNDNNVHYSKPLLIMGMAKKAGFLAIGSEDVVRVLQSGKAELVAFASDTSEGTIKRVRFETERSGVVSISTPYTKFEFSRIAGRGSPGTIAFLDLGLAKEFAKRLSALDNIKYEEVATLLTAKFQVQKSNRANNRRTKV